MRKTYFITPFITVLVLLGCLSTGLSQNTVKPTVKAPNGFDVNSFTGNLYHQRADMKMPAQGIPMEIVFSYNNTQRNKNWGYGPGWTFTYNVAYTADSVGNITVLRADGRRDLFRKAGAAYKAPVGAFDTLAEYQSGKFWLKTKEGWTYYFDAASHRKLTRLQDRNNNTITISYTDSLPLAITDAAGRSFALTWDNGRLKEIQNGCSAPVRKIVYSYDTSGNPVKVMRPDSSTLQYYYDDNSRIVGLTDELGNNMSITYNGNGAVSKVVSCATTQLFTYSPQTRKTFVTEQVQGQRQITTYSYDTTGRVIHKEGNCCGYNVAYQYDTDNNVSAQTNGNNQTTQYVYDSKGNVIKETDAEGYSMSYAWHPTLNKVLTVKDKRGNTTSFEYDAAGNQTKIIKPLGITEVFTYDTKGNILTYKDGNNHITAYEYNNFGRLTKVTDALNGVVTNTYDGCGNLAQMKDARNYVTSYEYDLQNRVTKITDALGGITKYTYDVAGNLSSATDALNRTTSYQYDGLGRQTKTISPAGHTVTVEYDERSNKTKVTDAKGNSTSYTYNSRNQVLTERDAPGKTRSFEYDGVGNLVSETDKRGNTTRHEYDKLNRPIKKTDARGNNSMATYDAEGNKVSQTDNNGNTTYYTYDVLNRLIQETDPFNKTTANTIDNNGNILTQKDKNGNTWTTEYDVLNRIKKSTDPLGNVTEVSYDANGNQTALKNPLGHITTFTYDALNRQITETNPLNEATSNSYDLVGNLLTVTTPEGNIVRNTYNNENQLISIADEIGQTISYSYDANGNRSTITDFNNNKGALLYDALNRLISMQDPLNNSGSKQYDANGNIISETDRNGNTKTYEFDELNRQIKETDAIGNYTRFEYDFNGNQTKVIDAKNNITAYNFDALNRLIRETPANGSRKEYTYDGNSNRKTRKDNNGAITIFVYDGANQVTQKNYPGGITESFTYDAAGKKLTANNNNAAVTFTYDNAGRVLTETLNGKTTTYTYNTTAGTRTIQYPGGRIITETRDKRERLAKITEGAGNLVQFVFDGADRLTTKTLGNGVVQNYSYDANNRLISLNCQPNAVLQFGYTYDKENNKLSSTQQHRPTHSEEYEYDLIYQLTNYYQGKLTGNQLTDTVLKSSYSYDKLHNRTFSKEGTVIKSYSTNNTNGYSQVITNNITANYTYDANGNRTSDGINNYQYDLENKLIEISGIAHYQYDALGRKIKSIQGSDQTSYLYAGNQVIEERNASDVVQKTFVYGLWLDDLISYSVGINKYYLANSPQGNIYAIFLGSNLIERYDYAAFGSPTLYNSDYSNLSNSLTGNNLLYCGRPILENHTLYDNRLRLFDHQNGRFTQRDQLGYLDSYNLYAYAANNPINKHDPLGLFASEFFDFLGIDSKSGKGCFQHEVNIGKFLNRKLAPIASRLKIPNRLLKFIMPPSLELKVQICVDCEDCKKGSLYLDVNKKWPVPGVEFKVGGTAGGTLEKCPNSGYSGSGYVCVYGKGELDTKFVVSKFVDLIQKYTGYTIQERDVYHLLPNVKAEADVRYCYDKTGFNFQFSYGALLKHDGNWWGLFDWKNKLSFSDRFCYPNECGHTNIGVD